MNAAEEVQRLLDQHKAVLLRQNKHLVYRLPNGQNFVLAKTPSDPERGAKNSLSDLRRALGLVRIAPKTEGERKMMTEQAPVAPTPAAAPPPKPESLKERIEAAIATEEGAQEKLLAEAQAFERRVQMLRALLPFAADPVAEDALRAILPSIQPLSPPASEAPPEPPQQITERVQVTRELVLAATQTFDGTFTVNDVMALMTGGAQIDGHERQRVRTAIAQAMATLHERGELMREAQGQGRRQASWRKAPLPRTKP